MSLHQQLGDWTKALFSRVRNPFGPNFSISWVLVNAQAVLFVFQAPAEEANA